MELQTPLKNGQNSPETKQDLPKLINNETHEFQPLKDDTDSNCSTPFVSAPSSPSRGPHPVKAGFFYSAPTSPSHSARTSNPFSLSHPSSPSSLEKYSTPLISDFEFSSSFGSNGSTTAHGSMSTADELFLNGKIRPLKPLTHFELFSTPFLNVDSANYDDKNDLFVELVRARDLRLCDKSVHKRTRSVAPLRFVPFDEWNQSHKSEGKDFYFPEDHTKRVVLKQSKIEQESHSVESTPCSASGSSSRSPSGCRRTSRKWVFLKHFLRSKSEGNSLNRFWSTLPFTQKEKKPMNHNIEGSVSKEMKSTNQLSEDSETQKGKTTVESVNGVEKQRSPHEEHYTENRAQAEESKKTTYLPYKHGLVGCLGFNSKSYGVMNEFTSSLDPLSTD